MINMISIDIIIETNDSINILVVTSFFAFLSGIGIIVTKNPLYSVGFLISVFLNVSIQLAYLGLYYLSLTYLIIYIGAVAILFIFVIIILDLRNIYKFHISRFSQNIPLALFLTVFFLFYLGSMLPSYSNTDFIKDVLIYFISLFGYPTNGPYIYIAYTSFSDSVLFDISPIQIIGVIIYNTDVIWLIIILLLFLIGTLGVNLITSDKK